MSETSDPRAVFTFDVDRWLERPGPFVSALLPAPSAIPDAPQRLATEWKNARTLVAADAPEVAIQAIDEAVAEARAHAGGESLLVVADAAGNRGAASLPDAVSEGRAWCGALPRLTPILETRARFVPHVIVVADRTGADIVAIDAVGRVAGSEVEGDTEHIHRGSFGGWSQRRFQQRAENTWESNAAEVAAEVDAVRARIGAPLVVVTGDVRARQFLQEHAGHDLAEALVLVDGPGRADADALEAFQPEVDRQVATIVAANTRAAMEAFQEARQTGGAADGPDQTLRALSEARVATLVVHADPDDERSASIDRGAVQLAAEPETLKDLGLSPVQVRLLDAAVWGALRTGADIRFVPGSGPHAPSGGLGAILRG